MDFSISERAQQLRNRAREFVRRYVIPLEARLPGSWKELEPALQQARATAKSLGLWVPDLGVPLEEFAMLSEELGRSPLGHYCVNAQAPDIGNMELLELAGSEEQKERWLRPMRAGEIRSCFSMTEPERAGSNPTWMDTRAVLEDGQWTIDGHKWFTSAAERELAPGKLLATRQTVQQWIADSRAEIDAARLMVLHAAWKMERVGQREARVEISTIKFFVANVLQDVLDRAVQVHGALGVTDDTPLAFWYRHERAARIYDGPDEVHRAVVARRVLRGFGVEIK